MSTTENHLIATLPRKDRAHLLGLCEPVQLLMSEVLCEPGKPTRFAYFPTDSFISLVAMIDGKPALEVGMVGSEGMVGVQLALNVAKVPLHAVVQGPGSALRIKAEAFTHELGRSSALRRAMHRYIYVLLAQMASSAACLHVHMIGPRLARWLLMSQDRAHADHFHMTQEFLAYMLGVRRVSITQAASAMQASGLISYRRGELTVLDRLGLEAEACSCYAKDLRDYAAQMH
ncbi:Crp/Fnr family transcriptional regulator [Chitinimonas viridis]|uniref:Crp/Fnr family transcriptional regulator n=1 Tax=Chitinimonas viridis TaxID=664880 RepID=A0ABT8B1R8_9NEIS|nr:Crp/Fnr family transcriptional regulator [Chitinimonas viridis]MDN3575488.1 Crp/Fnr family transcriptional regulator [Chitinimonas viridis]